MNRLYSGRRLNPGEGTVSATEVFVVDAQGKRPLKLEDSLKVRSYSLTGFNWSYGGAGPAQLALAILLDATDEETALEHYQFFKDDFVVGWRDNWSISTANIETWLERQVKGE